MKLIEIVADYVEKNNYDGLYNPHAECACKKSDLMPCDSIGRDCLPGYLQPEEEAEENGFDFMIGHKKHSIQTMENNNV